MKYLLPFLALLVLGCKSERETRIVEEETLYLPAIQLDTPAGTFTTAPAKVVRQREQREVETKKTSADLEQLAPVAQGVAGLLPGGTLGVIAGTLFMGFLKHRSDKKQQMALKAACNHADRMEEAETDEDVEAAKEKSLREQQTLGVHTLIEKART